MSGLEWNQTLCLQLTNELRNHALLWDSKNPAYRNVVKKELAWQEIAGTLNADVEELKRKIESLKGSYRRERWRTNNGVKKGLPYSSKWFAYEAMKFLEDREDGRSRHIQFVAVEPDESTKDNEEDDQLAFSDPQSEAEIEAHQNVPRKKMKSSDDDGGTIDSSRISVSYDVLQDIVQNISDSNKDECSTFGDYIAMKLRKFDDRLRAIAQHKIANALFELEMLLYPADTINTKCQVD